MSIPSTSTTPALPTIDMLDYDKNWDVPLEKAPRPSNSYMLFVKWHSRYINRGSNAQTVAPLWHSAPKEVKEHFDALATEVALKHAERFQGYVYAPKKKAKTKAERKENARLYPSSTSQRARGKGREDTAFDMVEEGSSS